jgi:hypothetical protein
MATTGRPPQPAATDPRWRLDDTSDRRESAPRAEGLVRTDLGAARAGLTGALRAPRASDAPARPAACIRDNSDPSQEIP